MSFFIEFTYILPLVSATSIFPKLQQHCQALIAVCFLSPEKAAHWADGMRATD
jgi:hypothetical protein